MNYDKKSFLTGLRTALSLGRMVAFMRLIHKLIQRNGSYYAAADSADGYSSVTVAVPNSYGAGDEGKVVQSGALAAQTARTVTANGTYDTTLNNSVTVNVSGGGGGVTVLSGPGEPTAAQGGNGDLYLQTLSAAWAPSGATPLEYIESTGTQYINTGYNPTQGTRVVVDVNITGSSTNFPAIFGTAASRYTNSCFAFYERHSSFPNASYCVYGQIYGWSLSMIPHNQRLTLEQGQNGVTWSGDGISPYSQSYSGSLTASTVPLYLFNQNYLGGSDGTNLCNMKLYRFCIYEGDTLVHDFHPVLDSNNVACLYDTVTETYFRNAGSGSFTAGPALQEGEILAAYVKVNGAWTGLIGANISDVG